MRKFFLFIVVLLGVANVSAQNIAIKSFVQSDMTVVDTHPVTDHNGEYGATIRFWIQGNDEDYDIQFNNGILRRENRNGVILCWVPKTTKRITKLRYKQELPLTGYKIPIKLESRMTYDATIEIIKGSARQQKPRKVFLNLGLGFNALSIMGPSAFIGLNIGAHNIEGGALIGLNKEAGVNFYKASNSEFMGTYDFSAMRFYARYGYDIKAGSSILITPQIGAAINRIKGAEIRRSTSGVNLFGNASGIITSVGCRLNWCLSKNIRLQITPEYDFCIKGDRGYNIIKESNSKIASWSDGLNVNAGLVFHF